MQANVDGRAVQGIIETFARIAQAALPHIHQLVSKVRAHIVAEDLAQVIHKLALGPRPEQLDRAPVDVQHLDAGQALAHHHWMFQQVSAQVRHPLRAAGRTRP
jgi:hypothetical protein